MSNDKKVYFFIENEFKCRMDLNLLEDQIDDCFQHSRDAITMNLVEYSTEKLEVTVKKIFYDFSMNGYSDIEMEKLYKGSLAYIKSNFIKDESTIFIGWVRDGNSSHDLCTKDNLGYDNRTDPIHDILNVLKNIYIRHIIKFENVELKLYDLEELLKNELFTLLPSPRYSFDSSFNVIFMPNKNTKLETFMSSFRHLFDINYYEKIKEIIENNRESLVNEEYDYLKAEYLVDFIIFLRQLLESLESSIYNEQNFEEYMKIYEKLCKYTFKISYGYSGGNTTPKCLETLKITMAANIEFYNRHKIPFKPLMFSTQMIEAEKGHLWYEACNKTPLPTKNKVKEWFERVMNHGVDVQAYSEFGPYHLKFKALGEIPRFNPNSNNTIFVINDNDSNEESDNALPVIENLSVGN